MSNVYGAPGRARAPSNRRRSSVTFSLGNPTWAASLSIATQSLAAIAFVFAYVMLNTPAAVPRSIGPESAQSNKNRSM
jgi:hypothetical protein